MAHLTVAEQQLCAAQGAWGITERCDYSECKSVIMTPMFWRGKHNRVYHSRECRLAAEGGKFHVKGKYTNGATVGSWVIPMLGSDVERIEQEIMKQVMANPHAIWNTRNCQLLFKGGTDAEAVRKAVQNLLADESLYRVGRTMSVLKPAEFRTVQKERKQEERLRIREKKKRARIREKKRLKEEKRQARLAAKAERVKKRN